MFTTTIMMKMCKKSTTSYALIDFLIFSKLLFCNINSMKSFILFLFVSLALSSSIGEQESLAVTIYNDDFAMVKDVRSISFDQGNSFLYFTDVSGNIQTETVTFKAIEDPNSIRVFEQNFEKNLVNTK